MSTTRKVHLAPTYAAVDSKKKLDILEKEIVRLKPEVEVTLAGGSDVAKGRIVEWFSQRHFFSVEWKTKSENFDHQTEKDSEIRAYFRVKMLSTQLVFKCWTARRVNENLYHYRVPEEIFQQQRRGALRVPVTKNTARLFTAQSDFEILDLSVGGLRLKIPATSKLKPGSLIRNCKLKLGKEVIAPPLMEVSITSLSKNEAGELTAGGRFHGLTSADRARIKPFLVEALRLHFKETP